ncbi:MULTISPECIES: hypothetical protein [Halobacteriovorax]|uniref:hypothetical protein n=1 Tax=Halobacteriovorax TaxID=1652133 RepID=UPI0018F3BF69|nr:MULTISPECIES: hypothetical protein [Halobacteriovorax]
MKVDYLKSQNTDDSNGDNVSEQDNKQRREPRRILVGGDKKTLPLNDQEILIVASKLKKYIKDKHGLNTSANVMQVLSDIVRVKCDAAAERAMQNGRKTLQDKDF